jgi:hypothetical protein
MLSNVIPNYLSNMYCALSAMIDGRLVALVVNLQEMFVVLPFNNTVSVAVTQFQPCTNVFSAGLEVLPAEKEVCLAHGLRSRRLGYSLSSVLISLENDLTVIKQILKFHNRSRGLCLEPAFFNLTGKRTF